MLTVRPYQFLGKITQSYIRAFQSTSAGTIEIASIDVYVDSFAHFVAPFMHIDRIAG